MKADLKTVLLRPRITEKATIQSESSVYSFEIPKHATKTDIIKAVKEIYNVTAVKVATVTTPQKKVFVRGKVGYKKGLKKAYVYLKKGQTIEII
ncbi:MAG: 50S ribosomal protein L23 [Candidatus Zambryskibacteria bacterium]|nr:50S ribosomal protein L23 [Candidatus Zambryskibacteria bacterium]